MRRFWGFALVALLAGCSAAPRMVDDDGLVKRAPAAPEMPPIEAAIGLTNAANKATGDLALYHTSPAALTSGRRYPLRIDVNRGLILGGSTATIGTVSLASGGGVVDTELPAAAALADNAANPTTPMVGANLAAWDGATWDRVTNGGGAEATALRVTLANDSTGLVSVDDNAGSLTVDNPQLSVVGAGVEATAMRVTLANDSTGLLSVDDNAGSLTVDNPQLSVVGAGAEATAMRVTLANDSTGLVSVDDNGANLSVDWGGTVPPIGAGLEATALRVTVATDSTGVLSVDDNAASLTVDNPQLSVVGAGAEATAMRVTIANDSTGLISVDDNAASLTVDNAALSVVGGGLEATALRVTLASDSTGVVSIDDNAASLTVDSPTDVAPDAAFPGTARALAGRASTAKPAAMSGDADAVGIWTSRVGSVRIVAGEVATVTSATFDAADWAAVAANTGNRLVFVSVRELSGAAARVVVRHGTLATHTMIAPVGLAANEARVIQFAGGVNVDNGVFLDWITGSVEITVGTEDHE